MSDGYNLHRFLDAQERVYHVVLAECGQGENPATGSGLFFRKLPVLVTAAWRSNSPLAQSTRVARIIPDGSSRNRQDARRDGRAEHREAEAYLKQYVEVTRGVPARWPREACGRAGRSGVSAVAVETLMNNAG